MKITHLRSLGFPSCRILLQALLSSLILLTLLPANSYGQAIVPLDDPSQGTPTTPIPSQPEIGEGRTTQDITIPAGISGVWEGTIRTDPNFGHSSFSALITLVNGNVGEIVGSVSHPSIGCGGEMRLHSATADTIITSSRYEFGPCLDGNHILKLASNGNLEYEWHQPSTSRVDRGTLVKISGSGTGMPAEYIGIWKGTVTQVNPNSQWTAIIALAGGDVGSVVGTFISPTHTCGGREVLSSISANSIELLHDITYGSCVDNGVDTLQVPTGNTLPYSWHSANNASTASGTLDKISGSSAQTCVLANFGDDNGNPIRQDVGPWADLPYGGGYYEHNGQTIFLPFRYYGQNKDTIKNWGCYLTSAVMVINYFARQQGKSFRTDPQQLNEWLQNHKGGYSIGSPLPSIQDPQYVDDSGVNPAMVVKYANEKGVQMALVGQDKVNEKAGETRSQFVDRTKATVNATMCALNPVILGVTNTFGSHYINASGKEQASGVDTWRIHDPLESTTTTLQSKYENIYRQIVRFSGDSPDRVLSVVVHSPVEIIMTDPEGRRTGFDPTTNTTYLEIPGSNYGVEYLAAADGGGGLLERSVLNIIVPILGEYTLQTIGTDSGSYDLDIFAVDNNGDGATLQLRDTTSIGAMKTYSVTYNSNPGDPIQIEIPLFKTFLPSIVR